MTNPQQWLHSQTEYNNKEKRNRVKKLIICYNELNGDLELNDFVSLEELDCAWNELVNLNLENCQCLRELWCGSNCLKSLGLNGLTQLERLECFENFLNNFDNFSLKTLGRLTFLNISDNNFSEQDLSVFSHLVNLQTLWIGNHNRERVGQDIYNRFIGSLKPLRNLHKLKKLDISNTDIDCGLEYLSDTVEEIQFSTNVRPESKVKKIAEELELYNNDIKNWRKTNHGLINVIRDNKSLLTIINIINSALTRNTNEQNANLKKITGRNVKVLDVLSFYLEEIIITTRKKIYQKKPLVTQNDDLFQEDERRLIFDCKNFSELGKLSFRQKEITQLEIEEQLKDSSIEKDKKENLTYQSEVQILPKNK